VEIAKGMVENFLHLYKKYKVIPLRNRFYNLGGSQPPFLSSMAFAVYEKTNDFEWLKRVMEVAEEELNNYWLGTDKLEVHLFEDGLLRYCDHYLNHITAEHESGWDMTSRFHDRCLDVAPVDLNCLIYKYEIDLAKFYQMLKDETKAKKYQNEAEKRKQIINRYMWDEEKGFYFDFNESDKKKINFYSLAGFFPLWAGVADKKKAERCLENMKRFEYKCGLVTTQKEGISPEGKQWDYPNGWAPLQLIVIEGLLNYGFREEAEEIARKWVKLIYETYLETGKIFEKYDVVNCKTGENERYETQEGFGWTNAVFIKLVKIFEIDLKEYEKETEKV
jgi:alpha,alpha-trehalase